MATKKDILYRIIIGNLNFLWNPQFYMLYTKKKQKFESIVLSYKNECYRKGTCIQFVEDLLEKEPQTVYLLADKLKRKLDAVRRYLKLLESKSKVKRELSDRIHMTGRVAEKRRLVHQTQRF